MSNGNTPRSMRDFDYFDDDAEPVDPDALDETALPDGLEVQLQRYRARERRYTRTLFLMVATLAACVWFMADYAGELRYAFSTAQAPRRLGNVADMTPADLPTNAWVTVEGITEHRGLTQKKVRGLGVLRDEYWYFRLVGSRGVFIEVPPDKDRYGIATRVEVSGRVVDPAADAGYGRLIEFYYEKYASFERPALRVIQVGYAPGQGRGAFFIAFGFLTVLLASNLYVLRRIIQMRRGRPDAARR